MLRSRLKHAWLIGGCSVEVVSMFERFCWVIGGDWRPWGPPSYFFGRLKRAWLIGGCSVEVVSMFERFCWVLGGDWRPWGPPSYFGRFAY